MKTELLNWRWLGLMHPVMPFLVWLPVALGAILWGAMAWQLSSYELALFAVAALLSWTLFEYILHRYLFPLPKSW